MAVGGGSLAYAALTQKQVKTIANQQITKRAPKLRVAHAAKANSAKQANSASTATNAANAANAAQLGGIAASGYTRSDCNSITGQIKGFASFQLSPSFSSTFTDVFGYNCSGAAVQAKRTGVGLYEVRFLNSTVEIAVASANGVGPSAGDVNVSLSKVATGHFALRITGPGGQIDTNGVSLIAP